MNFFLFEPSQVSSPRSPGNNSSKLGTIWSPENYKFTITVFETSVFVHFFVTSFTFYPESLSRLLDLSAALVMGHVEHRPPVHLDRETKQNKFRNSLNIFTESK